MSDEIIDFINENRGLPIYAWVATEVVGDDLSPYNWLGKVTSARIGHLAFVEPYGYDDRTIVEKGDTEEYEEYLRDWAYNEIKEDEVDEWVKKKLDELDFKEMILLHVDTI